MVNNKNKITINILILFSFIIMSFFSAIILIKNNTLFNADDMIFNLRRIMDLKGSIIHGNLFPDFTFNNFHGSSVMTLYPYVDLYPIIFLSLFIKSKIQLIYFYFVFNVLINFIISFYSSKNYNHSYSISYLFSIVYSLSNIFLAYNFTNMDFGMVFSYMFLPLIIFGFLKILANQNSWIQLSLGMFFIFSGHVLNVIIISCFLLFWLVINFNKINKSMLLMLLKSIVLFLTISSVIWIPILHLYLFNFNNIIPPIHIPLNNIGIKTFLSGIYGAKRLDTIGAFPIIAIFIAIVFYKRFNWVDKQMYLISLFVIFNILFFPWHIISNTFFDQIQHTYRFLIIPQILLSYIFALIVIKYVILKNKKFIFFALIIIFAIFLQLMGQYSYIHSNIGNPSIDEYIDKKSHKVNLYNLQGNKYTIYNTSQFNKLINGNNESFIDYIPQKAHSSYNYVNNSVGLINLNNKGTININRIGYNEFYFHGYKQINSLTLPIYIYNNEKINIYLNDKRMNNVSDTHGNVTINNVKNDIKSKNKIYFSPIPNLYRIMGVILSIFGWLFIICIIIKKLLLHI